MKLGVKRDCCPLCGGRIIMRDLCQYALEYNVLKKPSGKISEQYKRVDNGRIGIQNAMCENCDAHWDDCDFFIDSEDCFIDRKYVEDVGIK